MPDDATARLLEELTACRTELAEDPSPERRAALTRRIEALRRRLADIGRHPDSLRREAEAARRRVAEIDAMLIGGSWPERSRLPWLNDPDAYAADINRRIHAEYAAERERLVTRIGEIEALLEERSAEPGGS